MKAKLANYCWVKETTVCKKGAGSLVGKTTYAAKAVRTARRLRGRRGEPMHDNRGISLTSNPTFPSH